MTAVWVIVRLALFVAVVGPLLYLVLRRVRLARRLPPDAGQRDGFREVEGGRGSMGGGWHGP